MLNSYTKIVLMVIFISTGSFCSSLAKEKLVVGVNLISPWKMQNGERIEGAEIDLIKAIAEKLKLTPEFRVMPFKRCLISMQAGTTDIMTGLLRGKEREDYIYFIDPPYKSKSNKVFYLLKERAGTIKKYSDLYNLTIGVERGSRYFPKFDNDNLITKETTNTNQQNIYKLLRNRIDTYIATDSEGDFLLKQMNYQHQIQKADFGFYNFNPVYIRVSKASSLMSRIDEVALIVKNMVENSEMESIIDGYFERNLLPIPDYK